MGPKYNDATSLEESGSPKTYRRSFAHAVNIELLVVVKGRERLPACKGKGCYALASCKALIF